MEEVKREISKMTNKELQDWLKEYPEDMEVHIYDSSLGYNPKDEIVNIAYWDDEDRHMDIVIIHND